MKLLHFGTERARRRSMLDPAGNIRVLSCLLPDIDPIADPVRRTDAKKPGQSGD